MRTLRETTTLLHRAAPPGGGLPDDDLLRVVRWMVGVVRDLERLHAEGRWHGAVGPDLVRIRGDRARLDPPGVTGPPPEFRDPEWQRLRFRAGLPDPALEARQDVYGAGAVLYSVLENGPPPCGSLSGLTRTTPSSLAWIVGRALAEGPGRYPTAPAMREDLASLLRLARPGRLHEVRPEDLPSFTPGVAPPPRRLTPYRVAARRERRGTATLVVLALIALATLSVAWARASRETPVAAATSGVTVPAKLPALRTLLDGWRERLAERLAAAGEGLDPLRVPLVVASDVPLPPDLGWAIHPSRRLAEEFRSIVDAGATPAVVRDLLRERSAGATVPAALRVRPAPGPGSVEATLDYGGLRFEGVAAAPR